MKFKLIIPYYGKFPSIFDLWLKSCKNNPEIEWLLVTDIDCSEVLPLNVKRLNLTFKELKNKFEQKLGMSISLESPYKLCDYKPLYGYLFEEYLKDFDFWGYCDMDVVWGKIFDFLPMELFRKYDKILDLGHLSFIRNDKAINENFKKYRGYLTILKKPINYTYDEAWGGYYLGFNGELFQSGYSIYSNRNLYADIDYHHYPFYLAKDKEKKPCVCIVEDGRLYMRNSDITEEVMYVHFQKRKMNISGEIGKNYIAIPNEIKSVEATEEICKIESTELDGYWDYKKEKRDVFKFIVLRFIYEEEKLKMLKYMIGKRL